jgi:hypothetical protein
MPICTYGAEVWASEDLRKNKFKDKWAIEQKWYESSVEHVNIGFCKFLLGVIRKAGNIPSMSELGRFPLGINIICHEKYLDDVRHTEYRTNLTKFKFK